MMADSKNIITKINVKEKVIHSNSNKTFYKNFFNKIDITHIENELEKILEKPKNFPQVYVIELTNNANKGAEEISKVIENLFKTFHIATLYYKPNNSGNDVVLQNVNGDQLALVEIGKFTLIFEDPQVATEQDKENAFRTIKAILNDKVTDKIVNNLNTLINNSKTKQHIRKIVTEFNFMQSVSLSAPQSESKSKKDISILSWNILNPKDTYQTETFTFDDKLKSLKTLVNEHKPLIIALQESDLEFLKTFSDAFDEYEYEWSQMIGANDWAVAVGYKKNNDVIVKELITFEEGGSGKGALILQDEGNLYVVAHVPFFNRGAPKLLQKIEASLEKLDRYHEKNWIMLGDFNLSPKIELPKDKPYWDNLEKLLAGSKNKWLSDNADIKTVKTKDGILKKFDHLIYVPKNDLAISAKTLWNTNDNLTNANYPSDHTPILYNIHFVN